mgnify:CR=1 FL=1
MYGFGQMIDELRKDPKKIVFLQDFLLVTF